ncbi:hypothetical protein FAZ95_32050 [Trinickia violacea]|uniref:Uncharacterized protein n=1 Tax=Trinickia violacea TaxID=2571746 RepID=A0A4P8J4H1_9BURK|nr:hypothetical protein [Trinickia violacea]QCP53659.1 hypothetical protein FAZ95_32050 [Trinickia violacea]
MCFASVLIKFVIRISDSEEAADNDGLVGAENACPSFHKWGASNKHIKRLYWRGTMKTLRLNRSVWSTSAIVFFCGLAASCAVDPSRAIPSTQSFTPEMTGVFDVAEMSDNRAGFLRLTTAFSPDGKSGTLVYDYANGTPSMYVKLDGCESYTRHILPGIMHDDAAIEQEIREVRCHSSGSIWRVAIFRKGESRAPVSASMKVATGYEFVFTVPFTSTVEVRPRLKQ